MDRYSLGRFIRRRPGMTVLLLVAGLLIVATGQFLSRWYREVLPIAESGIDLGSDFLICRLERNAPLSSGQRTALRKSMHENGFDLENIRPIVGDEAVDTMKQFLDSLDRQSRAERIDHDVFVYGSIFELSTNQEAQFRKQLLEVSPMPGFQKGGKRNVLLKFATTELNRLVRFGADDPPDRKVLRSILLPKQFETYHRVFEYAQRRARKAAEQIRCADVDLRSADRDLIYLTRKLQLSTQQVQSGCETLQEIENEVSNRLDRFIERSPDDGSMQTFLKPAMFNWNERQKLIIERFGDFLTSEQLGLLQELYANSSQRLWANFVLENDCSYRERGENS